jgi:20S proteasome alpha/beta subunit
MLLKHAQTTRNLTTAKNRPKRPTRRAGRMTIAIGVKHDEGFLLCTDTLVTVPGYYKETQSKLRILKTNSCSAYLATAGDVDLTNRALQVVKQYLDTVKSDPEHVRNALDNACFEISDKWENRVADPLQLIGVIAVPGYEPELLKIDGSLVSPVDNIACIGRGEPLAKFLFSPVNVAALPKITTVKYAAYVLSNVKRHVDGCGGTSQFLAIDKDGQSSVPLREDDGTFERLIDLEIALFQLDRSTRSVVELFLSKDHSIESEIHDIAERVVKAHKEYRDKVGARQDKFIEEELAKFSKQSPQP